MAAAIDVEAEVFLDSRAIACAEAPSCELCPGVFGDLGLLILHYALDHRKPFCPDCRFILKDETIWSQHKQYHFPVRCKVCKSEFVSDAALRDHIFDVHQLENCRFCETLVPPVDADRKSHSIEKHSTDVIFAHPDDKWFVPDFETWNFLCRLCSEAEIRHTEFVEHFLFRHQVEIDRLALAVNGKGFGFSVLEMDMVREIELKPFEGPEICSTINAVDKTSGDPLARVDEPMECNVPINNLPVEPSNADSPAQWGGRRGFNGLAVELFWVEEREIDYLLNFFMKINSRTMMSDDLAYDGDEKIVSIKLNCTLCEPAKEFLKMSDIVQHLTRDHSFKYCPPYGCRVCNISCQTYATIQKHVQFEKDEFEKLYICQLCDDEFESRQETRKHLTIHWDDLKYVECTSPHLGFKCRYCSCLFWGEIEREKHHCQSHYHSHKDQFFKCDFCLTIFSDKIWWVCHLIQEHGHKKEEFIKSKGYIGYRCMLCCGVHGTLDSLKRHFFDVHPDEMRFYCKIEGCISKPFMHMQTLKSHNKMNHSKGPESQNLINEKKLDNAHPEPFKCIICSVETNSKTELETHQNNTHFTNGTHVKCSFCELEFNLAESYNEHVNTHNKAKYSCSHCSLEFVQKSNLLKHMKLHEAKKLFSCLHCKRKFTEKASAKNHMRMCSQGHSGMKDCAIMLEKM